VLKSLFLVSCALLNKFTTTFVRDKDFHEKVAEEIHARLDKPNMLQRRVEENRRDKKRLIWEEMNEDSALGFPELTIEGANTGRVPIEDGSEL